jgi:hypothetical protein
MWKVSETSLGGMFIAPARMRKRFFKAPKTHSMSYRRTAVQELDTGHTASREYGGDM